MSAVRALSSRRQSGSSSGNNGPSDRGGPIGGRNNNRGTETIHSGHFMVSDFEPESEAQDEEYEVGMPIPPAPPEAEARMKGSPSLDTPPSSLNRSNSSSKVENLQFYATTPPTNSSSISNSSSLPPTPPGGGAGSGGKGGVNKRERTSSSSSSSALVPAWKSGATPSLDGRIDGSLTKLFQCMSLAYRQKLTSPKWNRFKGVRLRWKDKIRLNNVIWRCWHMQFIMKKKTLVCQFASPLDVDGHNKPEAVVMEGKYWKRKLSTVAAEYKKWRLFYRNRIMGWTHATPPADLHPVSLDGFDWSRSGTFGTMSNIIFDDDMFMDFTDTLFSSLSTNQPFAFPNPREIARAGMVADFIQPGLVQLQPNLDDFMDTLEPLQDYVNSKLLPPVPEELENFDPPDSLLSEGLLPNNHHHHHQKSLQQSNNTSSTQFYDQGLILQSQQQNGTSLHHPHQHHTQQQHQHSPEPLKNRHLHHHHHQQQQQQQVHQQVDKSGGGGEVDVFAKPQGKPRGRCRSGGGGGSGLRAQPPHSQQLVNNANSNTLLSHLLAGSASNSSNLVAALSPATPTGGQGNSNSSPAPIDYGGPLNMVLGSSPFQSTAPFYLPSPNSPLVINFGGLSGGGGGNGGGKQQQQQSLLSALSSSSGGGGGRESVSPPTTTPNSGPTSPSRGNRPDGGRNKSGGSEGGGYKDHRRVCHINAEQKRRCNIKNGFDTLHSLIPALSQNPNAKVSKAAMLAKGAEYIRQLKGERAGLKEEIEAHRAEVEALNGAINSCQGLLPATGFSAPVSRQRTSKMNEMFTVWVRERTLDNWKFWLFSTLIRPLLDSYNSSVSTASVDEMCRTVLAWVDQHCSLVDLRPAVLTSLRQLCTRTDILSNPANLQEEAYKAVKQDSPPSSGGSGGDSR